MDSKKSPGRRRPNKNAYTTKSGNTIKLNRSLSERVRANREAKARKRAAYLSTLPRNKFKRILYRLHPKRLIKYWFSREGALMALKITGVGIVVCFLLMVGVFAYFRKDLPNIKDISGEQLGGSTTYYDRTGQTVLWQDYDAVKRVPVASNDISPYMKEATVAIEDKNFYKHGAFDVQGIARAGIKDVFGGGGAVQGGSTITQQLVKLNLNWTADRTIARKFKELILAVELEREYTKNDILVAYLNIAPYGNVQYGVESASRDYFHKSAKDLSLAEAAMLAAIPKQPPYYSPYGGSYYDPEALVGRQRYVIDQMLDQKLITKAQADEAKSVNILAEIQPEQNRYSDIKAPYFVLAAKNQLEQKYGSETVKRGGWKVTTTLDLNLQGIAEKAAASNISNVKRYGGDEEAMAGEDVQTGQMVMLVGGIDFNDPDHGQINYAQINLSPGSSFKPYDYVSLVNDTTNTGAGSVLYDIQQPVQTKQDGGYPCTNKARPKDGGDCLWDYDFNYPGPLTVRYALAGSRNVPAVKAMLTVGTQKVIDTANKMMGADDAYKCFQENVDVESAPKSQEARCYASSAIGDGAYLHLDQHVNGLATLGRLGNAIPQTYILKITDAANKNVYTWTQPSPTQVVRPEAAYIIDDILSDPRASYLVSGKKFQSYKGWKFAVKTGTTNDNYDGLMTSWSTRYAVASWVGYHTRNKTMTAGHMEDMTTPLTRTWMEAAHDALNTTPVNWTQPTGIQKLNAYVVSRSLGSGAQMPSPSQDIFPSWYVQKSGNTGTQVIDRVSGKLATSCTPDSAKQTLGNFNDNVFSADIFVNGGQAAAISGQDNVHNCDDAKPQVSLTLSDGSAVCNTTCNFTVTVTGGKYPLSSDQFPGTVDLLVNGQKVQTQSVSASPSSVSFTYTPTSNGSAQIQAVATDSVLYTGSASETVTMTAQNASPGGDTNPSQ